MNPLRNPRTDDSANDVVSDQPTPDEVTVEVPAPPAAPGPDVSGSPTNPAPVDESPREQYEEAVHADEVVEVTDAVDATVVEVPTPDVTVAAVAADELPNGHTYPLLITTAAGDAYFPDASASVTLNPELALLVAETPFANTTEETV